MTSQRSVQRPPFVSPATGTVPPPPSPSPFQPGVPSRAARRATLSAGRPLERGRLAPSTSAAVVVALRPGCRRHRGK